MALWKCVSGEKGEGRRVKIGVDGWFVTRMKALQNEVQILTLGLNVDADVDGECWANWG